MGKWPVVVLGVVGLMAAATWFFQNRLVYFPALDPVPAAADVLPGSRDVTLRGEDGLELRAWFVAGGAPRLNVAVLVAHGNGGDRAGRAPLAAALAREGLDVLLLDYRGYGGNPGSPSEAGLALDVRAAREHLVSEQDVPADRIIYFGESLGCAVVAELATQYRPAGLVLRSPFESLAAMTREHYPLVPTFLLRDEMDVVQHVSQVEAPTVVVYGTQDSIVPMSQSKAVANAAANLVREVEVPGANHNDRVLLDGDAVVGVVVRLADHTVR